MNKIPNRLSKMIGVIIKTITYPIISSKGGYFYQNQRINKRW